MIKKSKRTRTGNLWGSYLIAIALIALLILAAYFTLYSFIALGARDATTINLLGRQRMLSQRLLALYFRSYATTTPQVRSQARNDIQETLDQFVSGHRFLLSIPLNDHGFSADVVELTKRAIAEVDNIFQSLVLKMDRYPEIKSEPHEGGEGVVTNPEAMVEDVERFLKAMDSTVFRFEELAKQRVAFHQRLVLFIVFLVLGLLVFEVIAIFRPMTARIVEHQNSLETANLQLQAEIADRERTERALTEARQSAWEQEKLAAIGRLSAGIVHEIGNPLAALRGLSLEALVKVIQKEFGTLESLIGQIDDQIQRLESITREVSEFAAPGTGEEEIISLNELVTLVTNIMRYDTKLAHTTLELRLDNQLPAIRGVSDQLWQIIMNLVLNATEAIAKKPGADQRIIVATRRLNQSAELSVTDNGIGMQEEGATVFFEPFQTTKAPGRGIGLGLSICHAIVMRHDGDISIQSTPNVGTTVRILLPLSEITN